MRRTILFAAVAVLAAACSTGGGASAPADQTSTGDARTVTSDDGRAVLVLPDGLDAEITVTRADRPVQLSGFDGFVVAYDLQPSGLEFAGPAILTVTIPSSEFDLDEGVPLVGAVVVDGDTAEAVATTTEREDDDVVVEVEVPHFSFVIIGGGIGFSARVRPPRVAVEVGEEFEATWDMWLGRGTGVTFSSKAKPELYLQRFDPLAAAPFEYVGEDPVKGPHRWSCDTPTSGPVPDAYGWILVFDRLEHQDDPLTKFAEAFSADKPAFWAARVTGEATCLGPEGDDSGGDAGISETVALDDPAGDFVKVGPGDPEPAEAPSEVDVTGLSCTAGSGCTVEFAGDANARCAEDDVEACAVSLIFELEQGFGELGCDLPLEGTEEAKTSGASQEIEDLLAGATCSIEDRLFRFLLDELPEGDVRASVIWDPREGDLAQDTTDPLTLP